MSKRGTNFLETWPAENIESNSYAEEGESAAALAAKCVVDAQAAAIPMDEIEEDAGPIEERTWEAMEEAADFEPFRVAGGGRLG